MADDSGADEKTWQTTAGQQFRNLKEKMVAATDFTEKKVKEATKVASGGLERAIARWTPLPLSPEEIERLSKIRESLPSAPDIPSLDELVQSEGNVMIPVDEYESLIEAYKANVEMRKEQGDMLVESLAITQRLLETEKSLEKVKIVASELEKRKDKRPVQDQGLSEMMGTSISESVMLLGFSVVWLASLIGATIYVDPKGWVIEDYSIDLFIWSIGTSIWALVLLQRLDAVRTVLAMPLGMRVQAAAGVGLVTAMALLLSKEEFTAIGTVWGWTATIALSALLLSGLGRGVLNSAKHVFRFRAIKEIEPKGKK